MSTSPFRVYYTDTGVMLETPSGLAGVIDPDAALTLAASLAKAAEKFWLHQALMAEIDLAEPDTPPAPTD